MASIREQRLLNLGWNPLPKEGGVVADARVSIQRDIATLATAMDNELEESDPFTDVEKDEDESSEKELCSERLLIHYTMLSTNRNYCILSACFDTTIESQTCAHVLLKY